MWPARRFTAMLVVALGIFTAPVISTAQEPATIPRLGVLSPASPGNLALDAFQQGLRALGYVEGQTILLEYRHADEQLDRLPALAAELVQLKPDVIFTYAMPGGRAAKQATTTIPIVVTASGVVEQGIVASLEQPGGNMTGVSHSQGHEISAKQLELLKEAAPHLERVAIVVNPAAGSARDPALLAEAARALGVQLLPMEIRAPGEVDGAFAGIVEGRADALLVPTDVTLTPHRRRMLELAATHRLPSISRASRFAEGGGLIQYGENRLEGYRHAATYVDKILKGAKPGDLPMERPTTFELVINLKTAEALGLTIPPALLARATEVIR
jgi:putative tryptophan/tyrosine transport system substrate-binding protein